MFLLSRFLKLSLVATATYVFTLGSSASADFESPMLMRANKVTPVQCSDGTYEKCKRGSIEGGFGGWVVKGKQLEYGTPKAAYTYRLADWDKVVKVTLKKDVKVKVTKAIGSSQSAVLTLPKGTNIEPVAFPDGEKLVFIGEEYCFVEVKKLLTAKKTKKTNWGVICFSLNQKDLNFTTTAIGNPAPTLRLWVNGVAMLDSKNYSAIKEKIKQNLGKSVVVEVRKDMDIGKTKRHDPRTATIKNIHAKKLGKTFRVNIHHEVGNKVLDSQIPEKILSTVSTHFFASNYFVEKLEIYPR